MFHAHKTEFAEKGWMGTFLVRDTLSQNANKTSDLTIGRNKSNYTFAGGLK
jgi:hypothetical protein